MDEIYQKLGARDLWKIQDGKNETSFDVTEAWLHTATNKIKIISTTVTEASFKTWLDEEVRGSDDLPQFLLQRLVWLDVDVQERVVHLDHSIRQALIDKFGLKLADAYFKSSIAGITAFPPKDTERGSHQAYALCHAPKLAAVWSQERFSDWLGRPPTTRSLVFLHKTARQKAQQFLTSPWSASLYQHSMFPAFLLAIQMGLEIDKAQFGYREDVQEIEASTGFHRFKTRAEGSAHKDPGTLVVKASGLSGKLASVERNSKTLSRILNFILLRIKLCAEESERNANEESKWAETMKQGCEYLENHVKVLQERLEMQVLDTDFLMKRAQIQVDALFHIITQEDNLNGLRIARSSQQIAYSSYRDSSSMKTLAIVTMFFLPGSFVSALFSMPMFEWDKVDLSSSYIGVSLMPQFNLYWVITVPLTLMTFLLYFWWLWFLKREAVSKSEVFDLEHKDSNEEKNEDHSGLEAFARRLDRKRKEGTGDVNSQTRKGPSRSWSSFSGGNFFSKT